MIIFIKIFTSLLAEKIGEIYLVIHHYVYTFTRSHVHTFTRSHVYTFTRVNRVPVLNNGLKATKS